MIDLGGKNKLGGASIHPGGGGGTSLGGPQRPLLRSGKLKPGGNSAGRRVGGFTTGAMSAARTSAASPCIVLLGQPQTSGAECIKKSKGNRKVVRATAFISASTVLHLSIAPFAKKWLQC